MENEFFISENEDIKDAFAAFKHYNLKLKISKQDRKRLRLQ
jgi:hypothetical protein